MDIFWHGTTKFTIKTKKSTITINHQDKDTSVALLSKETNDTPVPSIIDWPGEYEINDCLFTGISLTRQAGDQITAFVAVVEEVTLCHLANLDRKLTEKELDALGNIDVLFLPVGGQDLTLTPKVARDVLEQIEPAVVIPMLYKEEEGDDLLSVGEFLKEIGVAAPEAQKKLTLSKSKLSLDQLQVELLERS